MTLSKFMRWMGGNEKTGKSSQRRRPAALRFDDLESRYAPAVLTVGPNDLIQKAVDSALAGDTIRVSGVHKEQVVISNDGHSRDNLRIEGAFFGKSTIQAPDAMTDTGAVIEIRGSKNVSISRFTIQGPAAVSGGDLYGIIVHGGGSAKIVNNHISAISDSPLSGVQRGVAIQVGTTAADSTIGSAIIEDNIIDRYQKNGIQVSGAGSNATIEENRIQGIGGTKIIAQNGIEVSSGANAKIRENTISGNSYSPGTYSGSGIVLDTPGTVSIVGNFISKNDIGVYVFGSTAGTVIASNFITGNTHAGIYLQDTTGAKIAFNFLTRNGSSDDSIGGIGLFNSQKITIDGNTSVSNKGYGLFLDAQSSGNTITRNQLLKNSVFDADDLSTGTGTSGTGNIWTKNQGKTSTPAGLVKPARFFHQFYVRF